MKKILGLMFAAIIAVQGMCTTAAFAASKHSHSYKTFITGGLDEKYHSTVRKCTSCGYVQKNGKELHKTTGKPVRYEQYSTGQHYGIYTCKDSKGNGCGATVKKKYSHKWTTLAPVDKDATWHTVTKKCTQCGATKSEQKKHSYSINMCKCGRKRMMPATTKNRTGTCGIYGKPMNDLWVFAACPSCGSKNCREGWDEEITGMKVSYSNIRVIHQHVICNNCGREYTNRCYKK